MLKSKIDEVSNYIPNFSVKFFEYLKNLMTGKSGLIQITGAAGVGKSTFAQYFIGNMVLKYKGSALFLTAGKKFSDIRLNRMFSGIYWEKLKNYIYKEHMGSYYEQQSLIDRITSSNKDILPPDLKFIIIDSISHNFRYSLMKVVDVKKRARLINNFYEKQIFPLIMMGGRLKIFIVFIHEVSSIPNINKNVKFLYKVFNRIEDSIRINMELDSKNPLLKSGKISINYKDNVRNYRYKIKTKGIEINNI